MPEARPPALVSLHDVDPSRLDQVEDLFALVRAHCPGPVTLLVIPGGGWNRESLRRLRRLVAGGCELAGHGWSHAARDVRGLRHRIHAAVISRGVAEHLALDRQEARALVAACFGWFIANKLPVPTVYVPPAWALGPLHPARDADLPFALWENLGGVHDLRRGRCHRLPLAGFEADTASRAALLGAGNRLAWSIAGPSRPLRVAIHPLDLSLRLAARLRELLPRLGELRSYRSLSATATLPTRPRGPGSG